MPDAIFSGNFFRKGRFEELSVAVENGIIVKLGKSMIGSRTVRLEGAIFPAGTDVHVHFRDPGETEKEDFGTGSLSAIYGGTTTVFDMPNNLTPVSDYEVFESKLAAVRGKSYCDFGLYSMFNGNNGPVISKRSSGIKTFLGGSTNALGMDLGAGVFGQIREFDIPKAFHAESARCLSLSRRPDVTGLKEHNLSRPLDCEVGSLEDMKEFQVERKIAAHVTSVRSLETVGTTAIREVTPHHLLLSDSDESGPWGKVNPPLRSDDIREDLFKAFLSGKVDILSSDHAPHTEADKEEFQYAKSGIIGVETRIPLMLALVKKKILSLETFYETCIRNPPKVFGLNKGEIEVGNRADFFAVNLSDMSPLKDQKLHSKVPISPFRGFQTVFPREVVLGGIPVLENGEAILDPMGIHVKEQG